MAGIEGPALAFRQIVAIEEQAARPNLRTDSNQSRGCQHCQRGQVGQIRRQDPKKTTNVKPLQTDAAVLTIFRQQARTNQKPADSEKDIHTQSAVTGQGVPPGVGMRAVRMKNRVASMADHHAQYGNSPPTVQGREVAARLGPNLVSAGSYHDCLRDSNTRREL